MNKAFSPSPNFESHVKLVRLQTKRTCCEEQRVSENRQPLQREQLKPLRKCSLRNMDFIALSEAGLELTMKD